MKTVREADAKRLLTLERQFCVYCWTSRGNAGSASYEAARVISMAEALPRKGESFRAATNRYRATRRRRLTAHLRDRHPEVLAKLLR